MRRRDLYDTELDQELLESMGEDPQLRLIPWTFEQAQQRADMLEVVQVIDEDGEDAVQVIPLEFSRPRHRH